MHMYENVYKDRISEFKKKFIYEKGQGKYDKLKKDVLSSKMFISAIKQSIDNNHKLVAKDFILIGNGVYFFQGRYTGSMAALIAFKAWNNECNINYRFSSWQELETRVIRIINWQ